MNPAVDGVVMSRLQVALQREIGGWPLYTIILALGQVSPPVPHYFRVSINASGIEDVGCDQFPDHAAIRSSLAGGSTALRPGWCFLGRVSYLV